MKGKKVLGIGIDGVIRDSYGQFDTWYRRAFIKNDRLVGMDDSFQYVENSETDDEFNEMQRLTDEKINLPLDTFDLLNHYSFENREEMENFMYNDYSFQIFASAPSFPKTMDAVNFLQVFGDSTELFDVVLFAKCKDSSIISTYHFLAKHACKIRSVKFIKEFEEVWDFCDVVISDSPEIFETKPDDKKSIKINHMYNTYADVDYSFDTIVDIKNEKLIRKIFE
jgi:hypothetical protein